MIKLIERFSGLVKGVISGFDRIVFKGFILPPMSASEAMQFCRQRNILNKDHKSWMMTQPRQITEHADRYANDRWGQGFSSSPPCRGMTLFILLCSLALSGCASTAVTLTPSPQAPLCESTTTALVLWTPEWRPDQKDVNEREVATATGLKNFFAQSGCFADVEIRRIPRYDAKDVSALVSSTSGRFSRAILIVIRELGPVVKLLSSPALIEGSTEVDLQVTAYSLPAIAPPREFSVHWRNGGPGVVKGVDSLPADMQAALTAGLQPTPPGHQQ
jgi:hypothetical protein